MKQIFNFCAVAVFVFTMFCSCAGNPPKDERDLAEKAFADAEPGKDCAKEDYLAAEDILNQAREAVNKKEYDKARELFKMVKEKSDAIVKYYRENPDKCMPGNDKKADADGEGKIKEDETPAAAANPAEDPKNPEMEFPTVHFEYNEYAILADDMPKVDLMAQWMVNFPERVVRIEGHADERGSVDYNLSLGEKRAAEVKNKLIQAGIDSARIKIVSYGEERPIDPASNEEAWFKNRRAEFKREN